MRMHTPSCPSAVQASSSQRPLRRRRHGELLVVTGRGVVLLVEDQLVRDRRLVVQVVEQAGPLEPRGA